MRYPCDTRYDPPFPVLAVTLRNPDEGLFSAVQYALLDTGSDGTLVSLSLLEDILAPVLTETHIRSHWGEWRSVQLFLVDIELDGQTMPGVFVVGDEIGDAVVLGRNVLNKLKLTLDGPVNTVVVHD